MYTLSLHTTVLLAANGKLSEALKRHKGVQILSHAACQLLAAGNKRMELHIVVDPEDVWSPQCTSKGLDLKAIAELLFSAIGSEAEQKSGWRRRAGKVSRAGGCDQKTRSFKRWLESASVSRKTELV
jgi:hypothetical protein